MALSENALAFRFETWDECVQQNLKSLGLKQEWALVRTRWRTLIGGDVQPVRSRTINDDDDDGDDLKRL